MPLLAHLLPECSVPGDAGPAVYCMWSRRVYRAHVPDGEPMLAAGVKWPWFCSSNNYIRKLITGVVPPLILTLWQGIVVPQWFYYWCQVQGTAAASVVTTLPSATISMQHHQSHAHTV